MPFWRIFALVGAGGELLTLSGPLTARPSLSASTREADLVEGLTALLGSGCSACREPCDQDHRLRRLALVTVLKRSCWYPTRCSGLGHQSSAPGQPRV